MNESTSSKSNHSHDDWQPEKSASPKIAENKDKDKNQGDKSQMTREKKTLGKRSNAEKRDEIVDKAMKMNEESDKVFMKFEEKILQMEEQRQKDNHQFQTQLLSYFFHSQYTPHSCDPPQWQFPISPLPSYYANGGNNSGDDSFDYNELDSIQ